MLRRIIFFLVEERARLGRYVILKLSPRRVLFDHFLVEGYSVLQVECELLRWITFGWLLTGLGLLFQGRNAADDAALVDCK